MDENFYPEYYEREDRHWWFVGRRKIFLRVLDRELGAGRAERRVLDVGCGTGTMLSYLGRYGQAEGVDADEQAVRFCHERGLDRVQRVENGSLPFEDATFDLVTALDVIEHIEDAPGIARELHRVLRPGGTLLVSVPAYQWMWGPQDDISHHQRRYVAKDLRSLLVQAGFGMRRLSYFNTLLFPAIAGIRVLRPYRPGTAEVRSDFEMTQPGLVNSLLSRVFALEAPLVERVPLPFGVSILGLARRQEPRG
jgi:SAM-dependent methyltransferase